MEAKSTYRAIQVVSQGRLELTEKTLQAPGPGKVRIRVEACGVCHSDSGTVEALFPIEWPRVPGHELVGRIDALGSGVQGWAVGQRVGVGFLGGSCGYCEFCRNGDLVNCRNQEYTGINHDGGYAEVMIAKASSLMSIPTSVSSVGAAPLLCAGLTTFSALRNAPAKAGELVAVVGIGGLGHLGVQCPAHGVRGRGDCPWRRQGGTGEEARRPSLYRQRRYRPRRGSAGARRGQGHSDNGFRREDGRRNLQGVASRRRLDRPRRRA